MEAEEYTLRPKPPYAVTRHFELFTLPGRPVPALYEGGTLRILLAGRPVEIRVEGEPWRPEVRVRAAPGSRRLVEEYLRVGFDYSRFLEAASRFPRLRGLAERYVGLRPTRSLSLYEALVDSVVKQAISLRLALRIESRLVESYGGRVEAWGRVFYGYPEPRRLAGTSVKELRGHGLTRVKAAALRGIARAELEGRLPGLREVDEDPGAVVAELTRLYGVGRWTAQLVVAMASRGLTVGPEDDLAVRRGLSIALGGGSVELAALQEYAGLIMYLASLRYEESKSR